MTVENDAVPLRLLLLLFLVAQLMFFAVGVVDLLLLLLLLPMVCIIRYCCGASLSVMTLRSPTLQSGFRGARDRS